MTTLVTGANGFAGGHLVDHLIEMGETAVGITFGGPAMARSESQIEQYELDLRDRRECCRVIGEIAPDRIYHLAGFAAVGASFADPAGAYDVNFCGTINLLEAIRLGGFNTRMVLVSSAEVYGVVPEEKLPPTEDSPICPESPYAVSKAASELAARAAAKSSGGKIECITIRPFNHIGPRQAKNFVCADFSLRIAAAAEGGAIKVGNLEAERDFSDVRDIVRGYRLAMEKGPAIGCYNLASGRRVKIRSLLEKLIDLSGKDISVEVDPSLFRPIDAPVFFGSYEKAEKELGWNPDIDLETTLADAYKYYAGLDPV